MANELGRPSLYKPEYCQMLIEHCKKGFSFESFAAVVNVNKDTVYEWANVHPDFSEAKKVANAQGRMFWEAIALEHIVNNSESEDDGIVKKSKSTSLNSAVWVFNMKNRFGWRDKTKEEYEEERKELVVKVAFDPNKV